MSEFTAVLNQLELDDRIGKERFRQIAARLASEGGLYPDDSQLERDLYEDALRAEDELRDYFDVIGCSLIHNRNLRYMRLYPPNASSPIAAQQSNEDDTLSGGVLRRKINAHTMAMALALRLLYSQKLQSGDILGEGEVETDIEEIRVTLRSRLKREPAPTAEMRRAITRELERGWRVIRLASQADPDDPETRVIIRPMLADMISESLTLQIAADAKALTAVASNDEAAQAADEY